MNSNEVRKFYQLIQGLIIPEDKKQPTGSNLRWLFRNAWISNRDNAKLFELLNLLRPYV